MHALDTDPRWSRARAAVVRPVVLVLAVTLLAGCMTAKVDETRRTADSIQANESIVLL